MSQQSKRWDVFISCAAEDVPLAERFRSQLQARGWSAFLFSVDLHAHVGSKRWSKLIEEIVDQCAVMLVLMTPHSLASKWVEHEYRSVHERILSGRDGLIIPVFAGGLEPDDRAIPLAIKAYQAVLFDDGRDEACFEEVSTLIRGFEDMSMRVVRAEEAAASLRPRSVIETAAPLRPRSGLAVRVGIAGTVALLLAFAVAAKWPHGREPTPTEGQGVAEALAHVDHLLTDDDADARRRAASDWQHDAWYLEAAAKQEGASERVRASAEVAAAQVDLANGLWEDVERRLSRARDIAPGWSVPRLELAALLASRNFDRALDAVDFVLARERGNAAAWAVRGMVRLRGDDVIAAREDLARAHDLAPRSSRWAAELALALGTGSNPDAERAARLAQSALSSGVPVPAAHLTLAKLAIDAKSADEAVSHAERAVRASPLDPRAYLLLGDAHSLRNDAAEAWKAWHRAADLAHATPLIGPFSERLKKLASIRPGGSERPPALESAGGHPDGGADAPTLRARASKSKVREAKTAPPAEGLDEVPRTEAGGIIIQ